MTLSLDLMFVRRHLVFGVLFGVLLCSGCANRVSHEASDYVGEYVFTPGEKSVPEKFAHAVVLRDNGVAVEIRYEPSSGKVVTHETTWRFKDDETDPAIVIGDFMHAVYWERGLLRLGIDIDNGQYYQKVR